VLMVVPSLDIVIAVTAGRYNVPASAHTAVAGHHTAGSSRHCSCDGPIDLRAGEP